MITIISSNELQQDGVNLGNVFDAMANHKLNVSDVQRALQAYEATLLSALKDKDTAHAGIVRDKDTEISAAKAKSTELLSHLDSIKSAVLDAKTPTDSAVLEIVKVATLDETERKRAVLTAQIASTQAELDKL